MKLSDKAVDAFVESGEGFTHPSKWNFEPTDFEDCIVLTLEEATEILDFLSYLDMRGYRDSFLDGLTDCCKNLKDRIEKA